MSTLYSHAYSVLPSGSAGTLYIPVLASCNRLILCVFHPVSILQLAEIFSFCSFFLDKFLLVLLTSFSVEKKYVPVSRLPQCSHDVDPLITITDSIVKYSNQGFAPESFFRVLGVKGKFWLLNLGVSGVDNVVDNLEYCCSSLAVFFSKSYIIHISYVSKNTFEVNSSFKFNGIWYKSVYFNHIVTTEIGTSRNFQSVTETTPFLGLRGIHNN
ncbi:hypothetical protein QTP88_009422 [Uroleucon formosanum]